jgi:hypothetical protein
MLKGLSMGIKQFLKNVESTLGLKDFEKESKKKSLKSLLKKLYIRKNSINKSLKSSVKKKKQEEFQEELAIISLQIKKGEKLLHKYDSEK